MSLVLVVAMIGAVNAVGTTLYIDDEGLQAQEHGAMFQNWDIIPPFYNPESNYNICGTPGGSGEATRTRNEFSLPKHAVAVSPGVFLSWRVSG